MGAVRRVAVLAIAAVLAASCTGDDDGSEPDEPSSTLGGLEAGDVGRLRVCATAPDPPYVTGDGAGLSGFSIEVLRAIGGASGLEVDAEALAVAGSGASVLGERCDVVVTTTPAGALGLDGVEISEPYLDLDQSLLVRAVDVAEFATLVGLRGQSIGVVTGTTAEAYLLEHTPEGAVLVPFPDSATAVAALRAGQVAAVLGEAPVNSWIVADEPSLATTQTITTGEQFAFMLAGDDDEGLARIDEGVRTLRSSGQLDELYDRYVGRP